MTHLIGAVQTNSGPDFSKNLGFAKEQIHIAAEEGLDLVAFPEMFLFIGDSEAQKFEVAVSLESELVGVFQDAAKKKGISILAGSIYETVEGSSKQLYNTSLLIGKSGKIKGAYRKIHLCDINSEALVNIESKTIKAGDGTVVVKHEVGKIGMSICYDLRFPSLFQTLRIKGAEIVFVPSAFFLHTGKHHWLPLLQARAIENQVYIVAPAQWGEHPKGRMSYGHTVIIDPWGTIIACAPEKPGLVSGKIDISYLEEIRSNMPVVEHRRPDCYSK